MLQAECLQMISSKVWEQNFTAVEELAQMFHTSLVTIRRGLNILCGQHLLKWRHGGARVPEDTITEVDYNVKKEH